MNEKTILITGANSGIGYQTALGLAKQNHRVVMVSRNRQRGELAQQSIIEASGNKQVDLILIDLASQESIRDGVAQFMSKYTHLDVLINNAANFDITQKNVQLSADGIETIFATNHLAPFLMSNLLLPALEASPAARIINIASKGLLTYPFLNIEFDNLNGEKKYSPVHAYYHSKLAQLMFTFDLAERLADRNIKVNIIRVPAVKLDDGRYDDVPAFLQAIYRFKMKFSLSSEEMAKLYIELATSADYEMITGAYLDENGKEVKAYHNAYKRDVWKRLWDVSTIMTQLSEGIPV